jgi:hypothetical protein
MMSLRRRVAVRLETLGLAEKENEQMNMDTLTMELGRNISWALCERRETVVKM